jgi:DNA-directed RNA polymerase subunit E'/Rpb7
MEYKKQTFKKRDLNKLQGLYSRCLLTRKVCLPITSVGKNVKENIEELVKFEYEGKCVVEGYIKIGSTHLLTYSCGLIERGNLVTFDVAFECDICYPVEGMLVQCNVKNITKAGIKCESAVEVPSPIIVFVAKDHHYDKPQFNEVKEGDRITVRIIGQRYELNDKYISVIGELVVEKEYDRFQKKRVAN